MRHIPIILAALAAPAFAGDPTFTKHVIDAKFPAISAVAADVDSDGKLDVIAAGGPSGGASEWSNLVRWYRAPDWKMHEVATLDAKAVILHVENAPRHTTGQGAREKKTAVVVTEGKIGGVWWCATSDGGKSWKNSLIIDGVQYAHGSAVGDIDRDGLDDIVVPINNGTATPGLALAVPEVSMPPNAGRFEKLWRKIPLADKFNIPASCWQHYVRLTDINRDGKLDALHGASGEKGYFAYWLQGSTPQSEWREHALAGDARQATHLDAADLNRDGKIDLVGAEGHGVGLWWWAGPDFAKAERLDDTLRSPHSLAVADFNGDGWLDVASCGFESKQVAVFVNEGGGKFRKVSIDNDQCAYDLRAVRMKSNWKVDLLLSGQNSGNLVWYENTTRK